MSLDLNKAILFYNSPYSYKKKKAIEAYHSFIFPKNSKELDEWILANKKLIIENEFDKLIIARDIYRKGWNTTDNKNLFKYVIRKLKDQTINIHAVVADNYIFSFENEKTAQEFFNNFNDLIERVFNKKLI